MSPTSAAKVCSAITKHPSVQLALQRLFERYLSEIDALPYSCASAYQVQNFCEGGIEGALWKDGVTGGEGVLLQLVLRFDFTAAGAESVALHLRAIPLYPEGSTQDAREAVLSLPIGKPGQPLQSTAPGFLLALALNGLNGKREKHQEGTFREWFEHAMCEWGQLEAA